MKYFKNSLGKFHLAATGSVLGVALLVQSCLNPKDLVDGTGGLDVQWTPHIAVPIVDETTVKAYDIAVRAEPFLPGQFGDMVNIENGEIRVKMDMDLQEFAIPVPSPAFSTSVSKEFTEKPTVPAVNLSSSVDFNTMSNGFPTPALMPAGFSVTLAGSSVAAPSIDELDYVTFASGNMSISVSSTYDVDFETISFDLKNSDGDVVGSVSTSVGANATSAATNLDLSGKTITKDMTVDVGSFTIKNNSGSLQNIEAADALTFNIQLADGGIMSKGQFVLQQNFESAIEQTFSLGLGEIEIDEISLTSGAINYSITTPFTIVSGPGQEAHFSVAEDKLVIEGGWQSNNIQVSNTAGTSSGSFSLVGAKMQNINNFNDNPKDDNVTANVSYILNKGTTVIYDSSVGNAAFTFSLGGVDFYRFDGYLSQMEVPSVATSIGLNTATFTSGAIGSVINTLLDANLTTNDKTALSFTVGNGSGIPIEAQFTKFDATDADNNVSSIDLIGDNNVLNGAVYIGPSQMVGGSTTTNITLADINQLLNPIPNQIDAELNLKLNPNGPTERNWYTKDDKMKVGISVDSRVDMSVNDMAFVGNIDKTLSYQDLTMRKLLEKAGVISVAETADDLANAVDELANFSDIKFVLTVTENSFANVDFQGVGITFDPNGKNITFEPEAGAGSLVQGGQTAITIPIDVDQLIELWDVSEFRITLGNLNITSPDGSGTITFNADSQAKFKLGMSFKMNL